jgi:hypothetical protein
MAPILSQDREDQPAKSDCERRQRSKHTEDEASTPPDSALFALGIDNPAHTCHPQQKRKT